MKTSSEKIGGKAQSIGVYYSGQTTAGFPDHYIPISEARRLTTLKKARFINRGSSLLIHGLRSHRPNTSDSEKKGWKVVGQTAKNGICPGFPRWSSV